MGGCGSHEGYETLALDSLSKELVDEKEHPGEHLSRFQVKTSPFRDLKSKYPGKLASPKDELFVDREFPPSQSSFGSVIENEELSWERIPQLTPSQKLFDGDAAQHFFKHGYCNDVIAAMAAVAQHPVRIKRLFGSTQFNQHGLYMTRLMRGGQINEIVVDDSIPVYKPHCTFFARPNKTDCWGVVLEKSLAKLHGSYDNLVKSDLRDLLRALTYSPTTTLPVDNTNPDVLWEKLRKASRRDYVCCVQTGKQHDDLLPSDAVFTFISCDEIDAGSKQRLVKLRNPCNPQQVWGGKFSVRDQHFWKKPGQSPILQGMSKDFAKKGYFLMPWEQFLERMISVVISEVDERLSQSTFKITNTNLHKANYYRADLNKTTTLRITLLQDKGAGPVRLVLAKNLEKDKYSYVASSYSRLTETTLTADVAEQGQYVFYAKCCGNATLIVESGHECKMTIAKKAEFPNFLKSVFMDHAERLGGEKQKLGKSEKDWVCSRLLLNEAGLGYIACKIDERSKCHLTMHYSKEAVVQNQMCLKGKLKAGPVSQVEESFGAGSSIVLMKVIWRKESPMHEYVFPPKDLTLEYERTDI